MGAFASSRASNNCPIFFIFDMSDEDSKRSTGGDNCSVRSKGSKSKFGKFFDIIPAS